MKKNQLTRGTSRRVIYVENKDGHIDGASARIGWVEFSKTGRTVYFHGRTLSKAKGGGIRGNFYDAETNEEYWVSGVKQRGSNTHRAESVDVVVDEDAREEYERLKDSTAKKPRKE
jgi:hypothetical protein